MFDQHVQDQMLTVYGSLQNEHFEYAMYQPEYQKQETSPIQKYEGNQKSLQELEVHASHEMSKQNKQTMMRCVTCG